MGFGLLSSNAVKLDALEYYYGTYKSDPHSNKFNLVTWLMNNQVLGTECHLVNTLEVFKIDEQGYRDIVGACLEQNIKPLMSELMQVPRIPIEWVAIDKLGDLYEVFHITLNENIVDIMKYLDDHVQGVKQPIELKLVVSDKRRSSSQIESEKDMYIKIRDSQIEFKNFKFLNCVYLSELGVTDAHAVIKKVLERKVTHLIMDTINLPKSMSVEEAANLVILSNGKISVDFDKDSEDYKSKVYKRAYHSIYNFNTAKSFENDLERELNECNEFYVTDFRNCSPVRLRKEREGEWIIEERISKRNIGVSLPQLDLIESEGTIKVDKQSYKINLNFWKHFDWPYGIIPSRLIEKS